MAYNLFPRLLIANISKFLESSHVIAVLGARQVGKTSLVKYLAEHILKDNFFYIDLEFLELLDLCEKGPTPVYEYCIQKGADPSRRIFLIIDEIQYLKDPSKFIKLMHDHFPAIKLIVTGSSAFDVRKKLSQSLAGRILIFELYPLCFEEFLLFKGKKFELLQENLDTINKELILYYEEFIRYGGYPGIVIENEEETKKTLLNQYISTYVRKDVRDIGGIKDIDSFNKLLQVLASQSGNIVNVFELSQTLGINRQTVISYLDILEKTFIIRLVRPFYKNIRSELTKNPKVFMMDTGMMHIIWLKEFPKVVHGQSFEDCLFLELVKAGFNVRFWRTSKKQEVDFVLAEKELFALEAKLNFDSSSKRHLSIFAKAYGASVFTIGLFGHKNGKYPWEIIKVIKSR